MSTPHPASQSADESSLRALYDAMMEGWNAGSAEAFAQPLASDVDFVPFDGVAIKGREAVVAFHGPLFETHLRGTRLVGAVEHVRFLSDSVALMHAVGGTIMRGARTASPARDSIQTLVAIRRDGRWQIAAFHNTRIRPIGAGMLGTMHWLIGDWLWRFVPRTRQKRAGGTAA